MEKYFCCLVATRYCIHITLFNPITIIIILKTTSRFATSLKSGPKNHGTNFDEILIKPNITGNAIIQIKANDSLKQFLSSSFLPAIKELAILGKTTVPKAVTTDKPSFANS